MPIDSHRKAPPGATITAAPVAFSGSGRNGVNVAVEMLRAMGSPHWRNHDSSSCWPSTPPVPSGMALGSGGASMGYIGACCAKAEAAVSSAAANAANENGRLRRVAFMWLGFL